MKNLAGDFKKCMENEKNDFKGFGVAKSDLNKSTTFEFEGKTYDLNHGDVVLSSITSCTNTSNPNVLITAGLLARNALAKGLSIKPFVKTSLSPGSRVVEKYLKHSNLLEPLEKLGFNIAGYGCMTCIGNSGELPENLNDVIEKE